MIYNKLNIFIPRAIINQKRKRKCLHLLTDFRKKAKEVDESAVHLNFFFRYERMLFDLRYRCVKEYVGKVDHSNKNMLALAIVYLPYKYVSSYSGAIKGDHLKGLPLLFFLLVS
uniref:Transposase n=1 Tax=Strongyloides venezuelensis TaxID=75913 RepID=A0A0K0FI68_STRVS